MSLRDADADCEVEAPRLPFLGELRDAPAHRDRHAHGALRSVRDRDGSLKNTIRPSPVKRSSVPSKRWIRSPIASWYSRSTCITSSGSTVSANAVKPRRSQNTHGDLAAVAREEGWSPEDARAPRAAARGSGGAARARSSSSTCAWTRRSSCSLNAFSSAACASIVSWYSLMRSSDRTRASSSLWSNGLAIEVVRAGLDRRELLLLAARRDHHHRQEARRLVRADAPADLVAVHLGHEDVEQDEADAARRNALERLGAGRGRHDVVPARSQHRLEQADVLRQVVDDQDRASLTPSLRGAAEDRANLLRELADVQRLLDVGVEARRQEALSVVLHGERGECDDRDLAGAGLGAQPRERLHAVHARQLDVHEHEVGPVRARELDAVLGVGGAEGAVARDSRGDRARASGCAGCPPRSGRARAVMRSPRHSRVLPPM